ncbi:MAG TPA: recombinase family protein [Bacteroidia bacterium]|jgi:DNA invertase Pin-like site-specific DNA recombinase|nr:recombinase family protein [Bacteroidia bacterium]
MKKIAYYIRCSNPDQNPELQIADIDSICNEPHEIYKENQSAWAENVSRPVFNSVIGLIKKKKITDLYVWDLDRIFRNRQRLKDFFLVCKSFGCNVHSFRQKWLEDVNSIPPPFDDIVKELLTNIFGWIAEEESEKRSSRIKMAVRKKDNGTFSYKGNKWGKKSLPKQTVDRVLELHKEGKSVRAIARAVKIYDKNNNERNISKSAVHKIVGSKTQEKRSK